MKEATTTTRPLWQRVIDPYTSGHEGGVGGYDRFYEPWWTEEECADYDRGYRAGVFEDVA